MKERKVMLPIQINEKDRWRFKIEAAKRKISMGAVLRDAIQKFIEGEDIQTKKE